MQYSTLLINQENEIITITINRERALNALNKDVFNDLYQFFKFDLPSLNKIKGVIVTGSGSKAFVAGADIKEFLKINSSQEGANLSMKGHQTFNAIEESNVPIIAAVNGFALGGGCELAMACHLRIASTNAKFGLPETGLALIPGYGGTQRMIQYIGKTKAMELMMTNELLDAESALNFGLINLVCKQEDMMAKAIQLIQRISKKGPLAIAAIIKSVNAYFNKSTDGFRTEISEFGKLTKSDDFLEGATAFIQKRKPNYKGY